MGTPRSEPAEGLRCASRAQLSVNYLERARQHLRLEAKLRSTTSPYGTDRAGPSLPCAVEVMRCHIFQPVPLGYKQGMDNNYTNFEIDAEDGAECVVLWDSIGSPDSLVELVFKVGEPVHIEHPSPGVDPYEDPSLWWIQGFNESQRKALISEDREGTRGRTTTSVLTLVKLNAMERLAAEYAF